MEQEVGHRVVADEDILPAVAVQVEDDHAEAVGGLDCAARGGGGDVPKGPVTDVLIEDVGLGGQPPRARHDHDALEPGARRRVGEVKVKIVDHIEIEVAITVDITKGGARAPARVPHPRLLRHVLEAAADVPQKDVGTVAGQVEIVSAVAVVVAHGDTHRPATHADPQVPRHVAEAQPSEVLVQPATRPVLRLPDGRPVGDE